MDRKLDELLFALMQNMTIAVSGEKLARDLDVSHSTLVRWIEKLRAAGVPAEVIESINEDTIVEFLEEVVEGDVVIDDAATHEWLRKAPV